ncbi:MAG: transporter substrate-binding domain-containing protein [Anaerolineales bacterium]|nr:transporter substrate-binding domain-containing protein [Anaerolineales bacterium]
MRRMVVLFAVTSWLLASCAAPGAEPVTQPRDKLAEIMARGTLIVATDADYVPQSRLLKDVSPLEDTKCESTQYTANQFEGFDVAVAVEIARSLGVEPCFVTPPWSQLVAGNWGDNWDIHVGSMAITFERMKVLYFSQPYYATPTVILVHEENSTFQKAEDLSGRRIGVCAGCTFEDYLKGTLTMPGVEIEYRIRDAQIVAYENEEPAIEDLMLGDGTQLDAVITLLPIARQALDSGKPVKMVGEPLLFTYASVVLDRSSVRDVARLLDEINLIISGLHENGTLTQFSRKHQGQDLTREAARFDFSALEQFP